ncbi:MAG: hypothetical protein Q7T72_05045 [Bacteroidales bacterium]|nr:hypothetical protein [Bacteroidales bacterium]MDP3002116.1 hypothetical protein [Bacteroidales bacterium]
MKKAILIILVSGLFVSFGSAQKLLDIYKNGPVKLIQEKTYGAKNNWGSLFSLYYDTLKIMEGEREQYKKIIVAPDGSVFMSHKNRHEIWKFGPDGNFVKSFGSKGGKPNQFPMLPSIQPVVDGKYIFTCDVNGRLKFFDLDGNYFKSITLKYMASNFQPINNGEILLHGMVLWKTGWRNIIVRLNITSGVENIIHDYFTDYGVILTLKNVDSLITSIKAKRNIRLPYSSPFMSRPVITFLRDGQFIISNSMTGEMKVYSTDGKEKLNTKIDIKPVSITEEDVKQNYEKMRQNYIKAIEDLKKTPSTSDEHIQTFPSTSNEYIQRYININQKFLDNSDIYNDIKNYYPYLPYFSNIIVDDNGNFLAFEFTDKNDAVSNRFNIVAYDNNGKRLARTSFVCDDYDLSFSESTFVISKGYVYAVAKMKNIKGMPLRLVKFKMSN